MMFRTLRGWRMRSGIWVKYEPVKTHFVVVIKKWWILLPVSLWLPFSSSWWEELLIQNDHRSRWGRLRWWEGSPRGQFPLRLRGRIFFIQLSNNSPFYDRGEDPVSHTWDTTDQVPEVSYWNLVQMPPVLVPALGWEPELYHHGLDGLNSLLCEGLGSGFTWIELAIGTHSFLRTVIIVMMAPYGVKVMVRSFRLRSLLRRRLLFDNQNLVLRGRNKAMWCWGMWTTFRVS